jgi:hypothetical protein
MRVFQGDAIAGLLIVPVDRFVVYVHILRRMLRSGVRIGG